MLKKLFTNTLLKFGIGSRAEREVAPQHRQSVDASTKSVIGIVAGNGSFPLRFAEEAKSNGHRVVAVCHIDETSPEIESLVDECAWVKLGELGKLIASFKRMGADEVAFAGGIDRVQHFGDIKLDARGAALIMRVRSTKDDVVMRGMAAELEKEGMPVFSCTRFLTECMAREEIMSRAKPNDTEKTDIGVGMDAIKAMTGQDIGQVVVVREGVVVAVEAVEGTNRCVLRGGELGGPGTVVVKFAKPNQDMRFDVPTVGVATIESMIEAKARVLAVEAGRTLIIDKDEMLKLANRHKIVVMGCPSLLEEKSS